MNKDINKVESCTPLSYKRKRADFGILDEYREHDPEEIWRVIEPLLKQFNGAKGYLLTKREMEVLRENDISM